MAYATWPLTSLGIEAVSEFTEAFPALHLYDEGPAEVVSVLLDVAVPRRWQFTLPIDNAERKQVYDFIRDTLAMGTLPFLFRDGRDPKIIGEAVGTGTGAQTVFPLTTTRSAGAYGRYWLDDASTVLYKAGVAVATGDRTIGVDTRKVTFAVAPALAAAVTADYYYSRLCRIVNAPLVYQPSSSIWQQTSLTVEEVFR